MELQTSPAGKAVEGGLHRAHRTSTFLSCAFRAQEDDQVTRSFLLCQVIKNISKTYSRLRKNSVYTEKTVALFRMVVLTESPQDAQEGRPTRPQPMKAPEA
jgi:hypothetical protein